MADEADLAALTEQQMTEGALAASRQSVARNPNFCDCDSWREKPPRFCGEKQCQQDYERFCKMDAIRGRAA